jgi:hypothetical protein
MKDLKLWPTFSTLCNHLEQISGASVGEVKVVSDMHERKAEMARQADAFIALPGTQFTHFFSLLVHAESDINFV